MRPDPRHRVVFHLLIAAAFVAGTARPSAAGLVETELDRTLAELVALPDGPPGAIAVVQREDRIETFTAGIGDLGSRRRMRPGDHMRVASVAKAFSGAVALTLVDRGLLSLDDTLGELLPWTPASWSAVTLHELLNHTSGVPDFTRSQAFLDRVEEDPHRPVSPRQLIEYVVDQELGFDPGSRYQYSNSDNILVGLLVEAATGRSYAHELGSRVTGRLGLRQTTLPFGYLMPRPYIHGYDTRPPLPPEDVSTLLAAGFTWASGGIVSTPYELNRFIRAYAGGRLSGGAAREAQLTFLPGGSSEPPGPGANSAGLGIFRYETECGAIYGHTGNIFGYTQFTAATLDGRRSVVVAVNEQTVPGLRDDAFAVLSRAHLLAACAALDPEP